MEERAHQNLAKAVAAPTEIRASTDIRHTQIHPARYLPGAVLTLQQHWPNARRKWGPDGVDTLLGYDMDALGYSGCITARGWDALHHPGSYAISLKLFTIANVGRAATGMKSLNAIKESGFVVSDSLKELSNMQEVRNALENLCTAASLAAPWNFSFKMLATFLRSTNNMEAQLVAYKKAPIIAAFVDNVLHCNVQKWLADADFYDLPALELLWRNW
jgi:hypothetical protein